jgi:divalent metal cation (Fe/Co/Zn/Cd) transporter
MRNWFTPALANTRPFTPRILRYTRQIGWTFLRPDQADVLDAAPTGDTLQRIRAVAGAADGVAGIDDCRARKSGLGRLVDIHVEVDDAMPVSEGHRIAHDMKDALLAANLAVLDALVT